MQTRAEREQAERKRSEELVREMNETTPYLYSFEARTPFYLNEPLEDRYRKDTTIDILATPFGLAETNPEAFADWPKSTIYTDSYEPRKVGEMRFAEIDFCLADFAGIDNHYDLVAEHDLNYMLMHYFMQRDPREPEQMPVLSARLRESEFEDAIGGGGSELFLVEMWLEPAHRGRGIGRQALAYTYQRLFSHCVGLSTLIYPLQADGDEAIKRLELQGMEPDQEKTTTRLAKHLEAIGFTIQPREHGTFMRVTDWRKWEDFYKFVCEEWEN